jgi:hypothetical protein
MTTKQYRVTITGKTPLLMHWDNIEWADKMEEWKNDPASKKDSKAGDDRCPAWRWIGSVYRDETDQFVSIPADNLMRCFMEGGAMVPVPGAKGNKTFKSQSQSGMMVDDTAWPLKTNGALVPLADIDALLKVDDFVTHKEACKKLGFTLYIKRAKVGPSKHIRVRPRFDEWSITGTISVWDKQLTLSALRDISTYAGRYKGLCDWRPGSKTPGSYGMFEASVEEA